MEPIAFSRPYYGEEETAAVAEVIRSLWITGGPRLAEFERRFVKYCGAHHAVGVSSWTTGAFLVLHAWGVGPGDEVVVPSLTFIASVNAIIHAGAMPVFADIDPRTWNVDPKDMERKITPRTKVIMPVDQLGLPCNMDAINAIAQRHGVRVLEDAACGFGSRNKGRPIGSLCPMSVFSLHARKVITTGEGGMIVTDDAKLAERLRGLRHQGMSLSDYARHNAPPTQFETYPEVGYNYRITDIQASLGLVQLDRIDEILARRRTIAERYQEHLKDHPLFVPPFVPNGMEPNWQSYMIGVRPDAPVSRNRVMERLFDRGIPTRRGVMASHREPPYRTFGAKLPHTEYAADHTLQFPIHPALSTEQQDYILRSLDEITADVTGR